MPRKNRAYKRGEPYRDASLFVIACEGAVREKEYFSHLGELTSRIRVKVLDNKDGNSAPRWVLDAAARYVDEFRLEDSDQLWFVMDVDHWPESQLRAIHDECGIRPNWFMALSNPCFEVWLYLHVDDIKNCDAKTCQELKSALAEKVPGGYSKRKFIPLIRDAHNRSEALDQGDTHFVPGSMKTKLYLLTSQIFKIVGSNSSI